MPGSLAIAQHGLFDGNLVILVIDPRVGGTGFLQSLRRVHTAGRPEVGIFGQGQALQTAGLKTVKHSHGAIDIHAAQSHHAAGDATKCVHQLLRLAAGAENEIDNYIKLLPPEFRLMVLEELAVAQNLFRALG